MSSYDLMCFLTELKESNPWLYEHHSKMLQMVAIQISGAQKGLTELKNNGHKTGELKFARFSEYSTFTYNQSGFKIEDGYLHLSKIGKIPIIQHRPIPQEIIQVTVTRSRSGKWFAGVVCDVTAPAFSLQKAVGIDLGIKNFAYDSDGHVTPNPLNLSKMLKPLARVQRKISRRQKGSNNRKKAVKWYQRIHEKIKNKRRDFVHELSTQYAKNYDVTVVEDLKKTNMAKNHNLSQKILDSGWGIFETMLDYKTILVKVNPRNTSIDCSRCGGKVPKTLAVRTHQCNQCGLVLDRDHNAAVNILQRYRIAQSNEIVSQGRNIIPQELREYTPVECQRGTLKQEEATGQVR
jgi:putative transposase